MARTPILTDRQKQFAELLVYNDGKLSPAQCAMEAGYTSRPRQTASELRNPKVYPLVAKYIGELRAEVQEKYAINFEKHITELAKIRNEALKKGAWSAAVNGCHQRLNGPRYGFLLGITVCGVRVLMCVITTTYGRARWRERVLLPSTALFRVAVWRIWG